MSTETPTTALSGVRTTGSMSYQRITLACRAVASAMLMMLPSSVYAWQSDVEDAEPGYRRGPIVEIRETVGDGVGFENGYFSTGAFIPLFRQSEHGLLFSDIQLNALNSDPIAANLGLGYRYYSDDLERIFGIYN